MSKSERTRQFIIEQSAPLFNTKGVAGTAMSDIMEATKMAKGGLYGHFESKEALSYAVVDYSLQLLSEKMMRTINKHKNAKAKLFAYLDFFNQGHCPLEGGCPMLNFGMEADDTNPVITQKIKQNIERSEKLVSSIITEGITNGEFKNTWNADDFAVKAFAVLEGGTMIARVMGSYTQMETIVRILKTEIEEQVA